MPVFLDRGPTLEPRLFTASARAWHAEPESLRVADCDRIEIGLVNNMPDLALEQTERQILKLLHAASENVFVVLKLYALSDVPRTDIGKRHLSRLHYRDVTDLWGSKLDGLIITGTEPKTETLSLEPYWHALTELFDWADNNTISTIASCLAVHAAVLHFDGINRCPLERKCFGVFDFSTVTVNRLFHGVQIRFHMPHSRWNGLKEDTLKSSGYDVLASGKAAGVDTFVKLRKSLFVFFQGHPEYESWTLFGEYRRDVGRFLAGQQPNYPDLPRGYFDENSQERLYRFRDSAQISPHKDLMTNFPTEQLTSCLKDSWHSTAARIYTNWLLHMVDYKQAHSKLVRSLAGLRSVTPC